MKLNKKQTQALDYLEDNITTEILFGGGAGGGKSILGCYWLLKMCMKHPGTRWLMGRNEMKTLKETTLVSFFKVCQLQGLRAGIHYRFLDNPKNVILFPNGSEILLKDLKLSPSDPNFDDLGSLEITGAFIDEANQIVEKAKNIVMSRIRHALDENGLIPKILMSCNPAKNWVYKEFYRKKRDGELEPFKQFIQALIDDNPDGSKHYKENLLKMDKVSRERLLYGNWEYDDDPATLIVYDRILDCFKNSHLMVDRAGKLHKITADIARFGNDRIVIGSWLSASHVRLSWYKKQSITDTAKVIQAEQSKGQIGKLATIVDEDGVGGGVVDILDCIGFVNNSRPLPSPVNPTKDPKTGAKLPENYDNLKSQCAFYLAKRINEGSLYIECDDIEVRNALIEELEQIKEKNVDSDGKRGIVSKDVVKEKIGRSPDFSDCLLMGELYELKPAAPRAWAG